MALGPKIVNSTIIGRLSETSIWNIRYLKIFFDVIFSFENDEKFPNLVQVKCLGCNLVNRNKELK